MLRAAAQDELHLGLIRELGLHSYIGVPLVAHDRVFGSIMLATAESGRRYDETDLLFAQELGRRAAMAIENARLYHEAEERAQAARVLQAVGDGVVLDRPRGRRAAVEPRSSADHRPRLATRSSGGRSPRSCRAGTRSRADPRHRGPGRRARRDDAGRDRRTRALGLGLRRRARRGHRLRVPRPDRGARARADAERLRGDGLARAAHAARGDLRRCAHVPAARSRARRRTCADTCSR